GRGAGGVRQGVPASGVVPARRGVPPVAAAHRGERDAQSDAGARPQVGSDGTAERDGGREGPGRPGGRGGGDGSAGEAAGGGAGAAGAGTQRGRLPVFPAAVGGGDRPGARLAGRHGQVQEASRPGGAQGGGEGWARRTGSTIWRPSCAPWAPLSTCRPRRRSGWRRPYGRGWRNRSGGGGGWSRRRWRRWWR